LIKVKKKKNQTLKVPYSVNSQLCTHIGNADCAGLSPVSRETCCSITRCGTAAWQHHHESNHCHAIRAYPASSQCESRHLEQSNSYYWLFSPQNIFHA